MEWYVVPLSGLIGIGVTLVVQWWWQRQRLRADLTIVVATWMDTTYRCLNRMFAYKMQLPLSGEEPSDDFRTDARELSGSLNSLEPLAAIKLVYGKGDEIRLFEDLAKKMEVLAVRLRNSLKDTEPGTSDKLLSEMEEIIRLRKELMEKLVSKARPHRLLLRI